DPPLRHLNQELVNHEQRSYWDLANERIAELQLPRQRKDAIRAVEILLTASEEKFPKDPATGLRADIRESSWVRDNLDFLQKRYGTENVIGCMLHQDESTPHLHAIVVPVTQEQRLHKGEKVGAKERLSARDLFSPVALRQLQTDYAQAMAPYGLKRGIEYSTAIHQDVRRYYGAQKTSQQQLAQAVAPVEHIPLEIGKKAWYVDSGVHLQRELERFNQQAAQQLAEANAKLAELATIATANALAQDRVRVLEKQLATSKEHERRLSAELEQKGKELAEKSTQLTTVRADYHRLIVRTAQGQTLSPKLTEWAGQQQAHSLRRAEQVVATVLQGRVTNVGQVDQALQQHGFTVHQTKEKQFLVREAATAVQFPLADLRPNGQPFVEQVQQAIERTLLEQRQEQRLQVAQDPRSLKAIITVVEAERPSAFEPPLRRLVPGYGRCARYRISEHR
ncbi:MobV family relaxase, partial [Hymenobacter sp. AT01-02]|uniref:MobV family relaxase n=1 Tax=Hymenobacter sp. AT01-02 TaxID=1571877 RepID=UPI000ABE5757